MVGLGFEDSIRNVSCFFIIIVRRDGTVKKPLYRRNFLAWNPDDQIGYGRDLQNVAQISNLKKVQ